MEREGRGRRGDRERFDRPGGDFLDQVREVCELRLAQDPDMADAEIVERVAGETPPLGYLLVRYGGQFVEEYPVGAYEGRLTAEVVDQFMALVCERHGRDRTPQLVYRGEPVPEALVRHASEHRVRLHAFADYQQQVWDHTTYVREQQRGLRGDADYPLDLYVDKIWAPLGQPAEGGDAAATRVLDLLDTDQPRFVLVLGDFGTGKTFLLHKVAVELQRRRPDLVPVLVTMRDLEKGRSLDELLAQHMAARREAFYHRSFDYLLRQGRIVLLFDGFDELALRTSYERVPHHFRTLRQAAGGAAKIVVTSRLQYFATDQAIRTALGAEVGQLAGSRIMKLFPLDEGQRRALVVAAFKQDEARAASFLDLLSDLPDLLDLASNPRMLTFMIGWLDEGVITEDDLRKIATRSGAATAGALYRLLIEKWLEHEEKRHTQEGGLPPMTGTQRLAAVTGIARSLWQTGSRGVTLDELEPLAAEGLDLAGLEMRRAEAAQAVGSGTLLVRRGEGEFGFIHQSVMEWLVANDAVCRLSEHGPAALDDALADAELTPLMADFLRDLAGEAVIEWARATATAAGAPGPAAKANAALILQRGGVTVDAANYAGQDLRGRDFAGQDLTGASFEGADLEGSVFEDAVLRDANLRDVTLVAARLDRADLTGADLTGADLTQARLLGADIRGATMNGSCLDRAALVGASLDPDDLASAHSNFGAARPGLPAAPQISSRSRVNAVAVASDLIVTGHGDGGVRIWDSATGQPLRVLEGHTGGVRAVAVTADGRVVSGGYGGTVRIWDLDSGRPPQVLKGHTGGVRAVAVTADGRVVTGGDGGVRIWDLDSGRPPQVLEGHTGWVEAVAVAADGRIASGGGYDDTVRIWDLDSGRPPQVLEGHTGGVRAVAVTADGRIVTGGGYDDTVRIWDLDSGRPPQVLEGHTGWVEAVA
ncbi:MAG: pentapeptide repeat-containing protein, partial [Egibacteraceae bacterium]